MVEAGPSLQSPILAGDAFVQQKGSIGQQEEPSDVKNTQPSCRAVSAPAIQTDYLTKLLL